MNSQDNNNYYLLSGDLNTMHPKWADYIANTRGISLLNWVNDKQICYRAILSGSVIPIFLINRSYLILVISDAHIKMTNEISNKIEVLTFDSDHNALFLTVKSKMYTKFYLVRTNIQ